MRASRRSQGPPASRAKKGGGPTASAARGPNLWIEALKIARRELRLEHTFAPPTKGTQLHSLAMHHKNRLQRAGGAHQHQAPERAAPAPAARVRPPPPMRGFKYAPAPPPLPPRW